MAATEQETSKIHANVYLEHDNQEDIEDYLKKGGPVPPKLGGRIADELNKCRDMRMAAGLRSGPGNGGVGRTTGKTQLLKRDAKGLEAIQAMRL